MSLIIRLKMFFFLALLILNSKVYAEIKIHTFAIDENISHFSTRDKKPYNHGVAGSQLAKLEANASGKFYNYSFSLKHFQATSTKQLLINMTDSYHNGIHYFLVDAPSIAWDQLLNWAHDKAILLFNISNSDNRFRTNYCNKNVFHTIPSYAMKADALGQWLMAKRLTKILMISGENSEDQKFANAFLYSAKKYQLEIIKQLVWKFNSDLRRSAQQEIPLFTQTLKTYDAVFAADVHHLFADYLPYNTWFPRPVIGSSGLEALSWHRVIEQWGAKQLQRRFFKKNNRTMNEIDYSAYLAVKVIAHAMIITRKNAPDAIRNLLHSNDFSIAAYKGRKLSFRKWSGQLKMPIPLVSNFALVSSSPQKGMHHPITDLDTLGITKRASQCIHKE